MKHTLELNEGKVIYEYENPSKWEKDVKTFEFISFKKVTIFKDQKKYQNLTVKMEDWKDFCRWMNECMDGVETEQDRAGVPF